MRNDLKVFDAHVIEPKNLWERFLDKKHLHSVSWKQAFEGMDPDLQSAMARAYNSWGEEMRAPPAGSILPPAQYH